jgi:ligand-binding sensor domain-containing protein/two-component sensor histidine kinase
LSDDVSWGPVKTAVPCLLILLLTAGVDVEAERLPIKAFTTADGLAHDNVSRIVKDSRGFLWFCTAGGLSRFDGYAFTNFGTDQGLPHSSVNDLLETRGGDYWVATDGGLVRFDPKGQPGRRVVYENDPSTPAPMFTVIVPDDNDRRGGAINVLREGRDGTIWAGTDNGLYRLETTGRRSLRPIEIRLANDYPEQRIIADVVEDARRSLWIATPSGLYRRWPDGSAARYTARDGLPSEHLSDVLEDHEGRLWVATRLNGFFSFNADTTHSAPVVDRRVTTADGLPTSWVFQLFETSGRRFWAATSRGVVEFFATAQEGRRFRHYTERNGLSFYDITALNEDLGGNLWLGTNSAGAMKLTRDGFNTYGEADAIKAVNAVFEDRAGHLCFKGNVLGDARTSVYEGAKLDLLSADHGIHTRLGCFDGRRFDWFKPDAVSDFGWVTEQVTLQGRNGDWWVGTGEGLYRFPASNSLAQLDTARPLALYTTKDGLAALQVFRLFEDSRGRVWVSTVSPNANGLARWDPSGERLRDLSHSPGLPSLEDELPRSFGEDGSGSVWIGFNNGLARYANGAFRFFTATEGLPAGAIANIHVDSSGRLWLASARGGLVRVDDLGAERPTFVTYTTAQGLSSNNTEVITEDGAGHIYVGGGHGLDRLDPRTGRVKHFTTADGLAPGLFRAAFRDRAGVLWFGMTSGLARLAPVSEKPPAPPPVWITGLRVRGIPHFVSALGERDMSLPAFAPHQNELQIDFVGLGFGSGDVLRYQYRLEGTDVDWSALTEQRTVTYASLSAGRYAFLVRAVNSDGLMSAQPAVMTFTIRRPLWQHWWFVALVTFGVGLTIYALYQHRVARLLEMANMRTRIATDLHDDIGANLTRIALLSEVAERSRNSERSPHGGGAPGAPANVEGDGPLASIARIARESVGSMNDIVWAINPARDSLLDLTRRMRQHADEVFTLRDIALRFDAPGASESVRLGVDVRRDLLLIFKEAVNNSARHSGCSRVDIDLCVEGPRLVLKLADNGSGFDTSRESEGQGLMSMRRRAKRLKGTFEIESGSGAGTTVRLSIPR